MFTSTPMRPDCLATEIYVATGLAFVGVPDYVHPAYYSSNPQRRDLLGIGGGQHDRLRLVWGWTQHHEQWFCHSRISVFSVRCGSRVFAHTHKTAAR
jgi:hypothetical protein